VVSIDPTDKIPTEFKKVQKDIRLGDHKNGAHYKWFEKNATFFDGYSTD